MRIMKELKILYKANSVFILSLLKRGKIFLVFQFFLLALTIPMDYISVCAPKNFIDSVVDDNKISRGLFWIGLLILSKLTSFFLDKFLAIYTDKIYALAILDVKKKGYEKIKSMYFSYFDDSERLNKFGRAFAYNESGGMEFVGSVFSVLLSLTSLSTLTVISMSFEWWLWIIIVLLVFQQVLSDRRLKKINFEFRKEKTIVDRKQRYFSSVPTQTSSLSELLINGGFDFFLDKYSEVYKYNIDLKKKHSIRVNKHLFINMLPNEAFTFLCYIIIGFKLINQSCTLGDYTLFFSLISNITATLKGLFLNFNTFYEQTLAAQEYLDFMQQTEHQRFQENDGCKHTINKIENIEFSNVALTYDGLEHPTINSLNLRINSGDRIAIVGNNGAGKTTFIKLLLNFYAPEKGVIKINGKAIENYDIEDYWRKISAVFQNHQEFSITIAENLLFKKSYTSDQSRIEKVLNEVGLGEKVSSFKNGLDSELSRNFSQDGVELSGGERQRLAIARALLSDSDLYVFDEPSSALDPNAEDELLMCMNNIPKDKIILYVSHRLSNVHFCNRVLFFKDGNIVADGTHTHLMNTCKEYNEAYSKQLQKYQFQ